MEEIKYPVANPLIGEREREYVDECVRSQWISSSGKYISQFEDAFARWNRAGHAVCVSNGTIAIDLALTALGISPGDEVIVPDFTFVGSVSPIWRLHAIPVLVPSSPDSWNVDPDEIEKRITKKTRAIIAVHLYGHPCNIEAIADIAKRHDLVLVEDCAEALGAKVNGKSVGSFGQIGCFSFFGNKVLTTGEGGMCVTESEELATLIRLYRDHGMSKEERYWHRVIGYNGRMTNLQAAVGLGQVERLEEMIERREAIHRAYDSVFSKTDLFRQVKQPKGAESVTWLESPVLAAGMSLNRRLLMDELLQRGIETRPFFYPVSAMPAYSRFGHAEPNSVYWASHGLNLPTYENLKTDEAVEIAENVVDILERQANREKGKTIPATYPESSSTRHHVDVSIILPTFNEQGNAARIISILRQQMVAVSKDYEILVMDDNSSDRTVDEIKEEFSSDANVKVTVRRGPRGLADSILDGVKLAKGDYVIIMDSDFNHDPAQVGAMVKFAEFFDIVSGSRFTTGGGMQNRLRHYCSLIYNLWIRFLLFLPTQDNLAGFLCIRRKVLMSFDLDWLFHGYGDYFFRLLFVANRRKMKILEVPVFYRDRDYGVSKTPFIKTLWRYTRQAVLLRVESWSDKIPQK